VDAFDYFFIRITPSPILLRRRSGYFSRAFSACSLVGGPIQIAFLQDADNPSRKISPLVFTNCLFDVSFSGTPPADAQEVLKILLLNQNGNIAVPPGTTVRPVP
jgi:hypothetical protein